MIDLAAERPQHPDILFVGGTGRSGTHVVSQLLANHSHYARVPIEARFHVNPQGFPDLLSGQVTPEQFLRKMKRFWWRRIRAGEVAPVVARRIAFGRKVRGLHKVVERDRFDAARRRVRATLRSDADLDLACRNLFLDLLWPVAAEAGKPGLIEMSCFTIAESPTLIRLFPDAKLIHTVRDGRDAGSSKVSKRQKRSHPARRLGGPALVGGPPAQDRGRGPRAARRARLLTVSLDELVDGDREAIYAQLLAYLELDDEPAMRAFFEDEMSASAAHRERWREGLAAEQQEASCSSTRRPSTASSARASIALRSCGGPTSTSPRERAAGAGASRPNPSAGSTRLHRRHGAVGHPCRSPSCSAATAGWPTSRSRPASTATSAACRICSRAGSRCSGYLAKLRGFWWHRVRVDGQPRGLYNLLRQAEFDAAAGALRGRLRRRPDPRLPGALPRPARAGRRTAREAGSRRDVLPQRPRLPDAAADCSPRRASSTRSGTAVTRRRR